MKSELSQSILQFQAFGQVALWFNNKALLSYLHERWRCKKRSTPEPCSLQQHSSAFHSSERLNHV